VSVISSDNTFLNLFNGHNVINVDIGLTLVIVLVTVFGTVKVLTVNFLIYQLIDLG
jgi:hypothetical protein